MEQHDSAALATHYLQDAITNQTLFVLLVATPNDTAGIISNCPQSEVRALAQLLRDTADRITQHYTN